MNQQPRETRELERCIEQAQKLREHSNMLATRLSAARTRLIGESEPQADSSNQVCPVPSCEIANLRETLDAIGSNLQDIARYTDSFERL